MTNHKVNEERTVFVTLTDLNYLRKAVQTIKDLRTRGNWTGDLVLITVDFNIDIELKNLYNIIDISFPQINKTELLNKIGKDGFINSDKRELNKLNQWEKIHVFDKYFKNWDRVVFVDAGLRILDDVYNLLEVEYKNSFVSPNDNGDGPEKQNKTFSCQLELVNNELVDQLVNEYSENILTGQYFLNCIWIYDTIILDVIDKQEFIDTMNKYPLCRTNEMAVMNLILNFKYNLWIEMPYKTSNDKILFIWCELNRHGSYWTEYCCIKYSTTIGFDV